ETGKEQGGQSTGQTSPFSGISCRNYNRRGIAVMLSGDAITRPLSGFNSADLVVNMPVITDSITRFMAVYVCGDPPEIGSVRSARDDFIPLVLGWDLIYAHWGGSHFALEKLASVAVDNLDALPDYGQAFYRKSGIPMPHNGFTSMPRLLKAAQKLNYSLIGKAISFFPHLPVQQDICQAADCQDSKKLDLGFPGNFAVHYVYDGTKNEFRRWRGGQPETDKNDSQPVAAKVVVIMRVKSQQIEGQYNDVGVVGTGDCAVYQNGVEILGRWEKKSETAPLRFLDGSGQEIEFTPGQIWLEMVQTNQAVTWQ
ncbi:MAG: hypothetical protein COU85_02890, partial [Candidatus Portnoybacteria bacterium CG10_big_fil_rev_8_21_14_0_10_44_7]